MTELRKKDDEPVAATADIVGDTAADTAVGADARQRMGVRLAPVNNSDQPVLANYTTVNLAPGMAFIDFGFLEPGLLAAIPRVAKQDGKLLQAVNEKLALRVAMGYAGLAGLHQQLERVLSGLRAAATSRSTKAGNS